MDTMLIHAALFLTGTLALAGFACYICRGRPATLRLSGRRARERRTLQDIEWHLFAEVKATESDNSRQIGASLTSNASSSQTKAVIMKVFRRNNAEKGSQHQKHS